MQCRKSEMFKMKVLAEEKEPCRGSLEKFMMHIKEDEQHKNLFIMIPEKFENEKKNTSQFEEKMLLVCHIPGLLTMKKGWQNEKSLYAADIRGYRSLSTYTEAAGLMSSLSIQLAKLVQNLEDYLISPDHILLDRKYIFVSDSGEMKFLYLPFFTEDIRSQFIQFLEDIRPGLYEEKDIFCSRLLRLVKENKDPWKKIERNEMASDRDEDEEMPWRFAKKNIEKSDLSENIWNMDDQGGKTHPENEKTEERMANEEAEKNKLKKIGSRLGGMAAMTAFLLVVVLITFMILKTGILDTSAETISIWLNKAMNIAAENLNYIVAAILVVVAAVILFIRRRKHIEKMEVQQEDKEQSRIDQLQVEQPLDANKSRWMIL